MKRLTLALTLAALLAATTAYAGWWQTFGGEERDEGACVQQTTDKGYVISGLTLSFGRPSQFDIWLIKLDSLGNKMWDQTYEAGWGNSIVRETSDGGFIIAGATIIKTNENGDTLWTREYPATKSRCVQECTDGDYIITGQTLSPEDLLLIKLDDEGNILWQRTYQKGNYGSGGSFVDQTLDGNYIVTGYFSDTLMEGDEILAYKYTLWLLKVDTVGDTIWTRGYGGDDWDEADNANCVREISDSGYIITGNKGGESGC